MTPVALPSTLGGTGTTLPPPHEEQRVKRFPLSLRM